MAMRELTSQEIEALVGGRDATTGITYPPRGMQPYYEWLMRSLHALSQASAGWLRVSRDDASGASVRIAPGRCTVDGVAHELPATVLDLAAYDGQTVYAWIGGDGAAAAGRDADGWPAGAHVKLAEVSLVGGSVDSIIDRRSEQMLSGGLSAAVAAQLPRVAPTLASEGDTSTPSAIHIQVRSALGEALPGQRLVRVRVCEANGFAASAEANLAVAGASELVETISPGVDLVVRTSAAGLAQLTLTNPVAQTVTLRTGPAPVGAALGDYSAALNVTHL